MSEILVTASVALAAEVMHALLSDELDEWSAKRMNYSTGEPISGVWGNCHDKKTSGFFLKRISAFSETLKNVRIMKIVPGSIPIQEAYDISDDSDARMNKVVDFHLGTDNSPSQIIVRIFLDDDDEYKEKEALWNSWELFYVQAITCLKHPNSNFANYVVLGLNALR